MTLKKKVLNLRVRDFFKKVFKDNLIKTKKIRVDRTRQVRKFSSNFLFEKKKNEFMTSFARMRIGRSISVDTGILANRKLTPKEIPNWINRKVAGKNAKRLKKFKKFNRIKKTFKKYRGLPFYRRFPKELVRQNPLTRFYYSNLELLRFNYSYLLNFHTAIGNTSKSWINPGIFSKILAIRNDMILYDLSFTFIALKKGLQSIFQVSKFKGSVLGYVDLENNYKFSGAGFDHFLRSWLPGYLTNFKQVMKNILSLQTKNIFNLTRRQKKFLQNIDLKRNLPLNYYFYFWKKKVRSKENFTKIPSIPSFGFSLEDYNIWINECQKIGVRTMVVCDSESFPHKVDYPLVGNQKSIPLSFFLVKLVAETVSSGKRFDYFSFIGFNFITPFIKSLR